MATDFTSDTPSLGADLFALLVNDEQPQVQIAGPSQLFVPEEEVEAPEDDLDSALSELVAEDEDVDEGELLDVSPPDTVIELDTSMFETSQPEAPAPAVGSGSGLMRALSDLSAAQGPMTPRELRDYISRGAHSTNIDPTGQRLRTTIRAIMRRNA